MAKLIFNDLRPCAMDFLDSETFAKAERGIYGTPEFTTQIEIDIPVKGFALYSYETGDVLNCPDKVDRKWVVPVLDLDRPGFDYEDFLARRPAEYPHVETLYSEVIGETILFLHKTMTIHAPDYLLKTLCKTYGVFRNGYPEGDDWVEWRGWVFQGTDGSVSPDVEDWARSRRRYEGAAWSGWHKRHLGSLGQRKYEAVLRVQDGEDTFLFFGEFDPTECNSVDTLTESFTHDSDMLELAVDIQTEKDPVRLNFDRAIYADLIAAHLYQQWQDVYGGSEKTPWRATLATQAERCSLELVDGLKNGPHMITPPKGSLKMIGDLAVARLRGQSGLLKRAELHFTGTPKRKRSAGARRRVDLEALDDQTIHELPLSLMTGPSTDASFDPMKREFILLGLGGVGTRNFGYRAPPPCPAEELDDLRMCHERLRAAHDHWNTWTDRVIIHVAREGFRFYFALRTLLIAGHRMKQGRSHRFPALYGFSYFVPRAATLFQRDVVFRGLSPWVAEELEEVPGLMLAMENALNEAKLQISRIPVDLNWNCLLSATVWDSERKDEKFAYDIPEGHAILGVGWGRKEVEELDSRDRSHEARYDGYGKAAVRVDGQWNLGYRGGTNRTAQRRMLPSLRLTDVVKDMAAALEDRSILMVQGADSHQLYATRCTGLQRALDSEDEGWTPPAAPDDTEAFRVRRDLDLV